MAKLELLEGLRSVDLKLGTAAAKTITVQFGVKAPAGTYTVCFNNSDFTRGCAVEYVIAAGEANIDVVKSVTLTLDTTGTWKTDNTQGLYVSWSLMCGANYRTVSGVWTAVGGNGSIGTANQFNFMGTNGNVFELFDVSLTEGTVAPPFQVPDYASELALCQRYYEKSFPLAVVPAQNGGYNGAFGFSQNIAASTLMICGTVCLVPKRIINPTITFYNPGAANAFIMNATTGVSWTAQYM